MSKVQIQLRLERFSVNSNDFHLSGLDKLTVRMERYLHPAKDQSAKVLEICLDLMRKGVDHAFPVGTGCRTRAEKELYRKDRLQLHSCPDDNVARYHMLRSNLNAA